MAAVAPAVGEDAARMNEISSSSSPKVPMAAVKNSKDEIMALARNLSDQPVPNLEPDVWGLLIAISKNARQRAQGMHILLSADTHCLGRCVEDTHFQLASMAISANHCKLYRLISKLDPRSAADVFLKDTSTNGTYHNWSKLGKHVPEVKLRHGDIISFIALPHDDKSYAFVYKEIHTVMPLENGAAAKRKSEDFLVESKRLKGIGIGAPDGPVSLDDVRSLQRSNMELRQQLESHVMTIEELRNQIRASKTQHENELKKVEATVSSSFVDQIKELQHVVNDKTKEVNNFKNESAEMRVAVKDLTERLGAFMQSRADADEIIQSQKTTIAELEAQLEEERNQRKEEREKAATDLKCALQRAQVEAHDEIKRQRDIHERQHKEQQEVISKLQESEKESRLLVETLRLKLEDARENLVVSEKKVRQLELQVKDEQQALANSKNKSESLESELNRLQKDLESEKVAREEAWAKVSALELEIAAAIRDLSMEKQRFQGARERIILRETQLRAFYSTTEEISALFAKQQEQLKAMQRTLEDEEHYGDISIGVNLNEPPSGIVSVRIRENPKSRNAKEDPGVCTPKNAIGASNSFGSGDDDNTSTTQKHDCDMGSQDGNTQDLECTSVDRSSKRLDAKSDIAGMTADPEEDPVETEQVMETESPTGYASLDEKHAALLKCSNLVEDTMQLDDDLQVHEVLEPHDMLDHTTGGGSQSKLQEKETSIVRTADLLASEVAGSWAVSTAPSVNGENESPRSVGETEAGAADTAPAASATMLPFSEGQAEGSQSNANVATKLSNEHKRLSAMIEIVAPEFKQQFCGDVGAGEKRDSVSDAETDGNASSDTNDDDTVDNGGAVAATAAEDDEEDSMNEGDEMIEDSVG